MGEAMAKDSLYFTGDRLFWDDPDFQTTEEKIVYAMLWQSITTDIAGIHARNDQIDALRVGMSVSKYQKTLQTLSIAEKVRLYDGRIWIKAAIWRNLGKGNYSERQLIAVNSRIKAHLGSPIVKDIIEYYQKKHSLLLVEEYPIDTLSIPYSPVPVPVTESVPEPEPESETVINPPVFLIKDFVDLYHQELPFGRKIKAVTKTRRDHIQARFKTYPDKQFWVDLFIKIKESKFLRGEIPPRDGHKQFQMSIDFVINENRIVDILEGKYSKISSAIDFSKLPTMEEF